MHMGRKIFPTLSLGLQPGLAIAAWTPGVMSAGDAMREHGLAMQALCFDVQCFDVQCADPPKWAGPRRSSRISAQKSGLVMASAKNGRVDDAGLSVGKKFVKRCDPTLCSHALQM